MMMADAVLGLLVNKLDTIIENEVKLIGGAMEEFETLRDQINHLEPYIRGIYRHLDGADLPAEVEDQLRELAKQLHKVYWRAEDAVDIYLSNAALYETKIWATKLLCLGVPVLKRRRQLSVRAQGIKEEINRIMSNRDMYAISTAQLINTSTTTSSTMSAASTTMPMAASNHHHYYIQQARNVPTYSNNYVRRIVVEEGAADVVGFEDKSEEVIKMLLLKQFGDDDDNNEKQAIEHHYRRVVSIIGMGGLGKSTLAMKIYNNSRVNAQFDTKVWVAVSQDGNVKDLLINILEEMCIKIEQERKDDIRFLKSEFSKALDNKCYLIVLDDIWTPQLWEELKMCLPPDQKNGSRIMLTSRVINVANAASTDSSCTYQIKPLGDDDSWLLFCSKALKGNACPDSLVKTGKDIVSKCKGLPLAIVVLGGVLSAAEATPSQRYWSSLLADTSWHNECSKILSLSYQCLPIHLKTCFLYVGVFPEDYKISARQLCWLWVAEGFIPSQKVVGILLFEEDVAMQYLIELADRNLITVRERGLDGAILYCGIHDLLRECCVNEAVKINLYEAVDGRRRAALEDVTAEGPRRLTVSCDKLETSSSAFLKRLRTLLFFDGGSTVQSGLLQSCYENLAAARVLQFRMESSASHDRIKNLLLLRYWSVSTMFFVLPSLSKMLNLQILSLRTVECAIRFQDWLWNLKHLRHVSVRMAATLPDARSSDDKLLKLQTLENICIEKHTLKLISRGRFPNLRKISLFLSGEVLGNQVYDCEWVEETVLQSLEIKSLPLLESIRIYLLLDWDLSWGWTKINNMFSNKAYDNRASALDSRCTTTITTTPLLGVFSPKLTDVRLYKVWLTHDQWMLLGSLENLRVLCLGLKYPAVEHQKKPIIEFKAGAFPQLITLVLNCSGHVFNSTNNTALPQLISSNEENKLSPLNVLALWLKRLETGDGRGVIWTRYVGVSSSPDLTYEVLSY